MEIIISTRFADFVKKRDNVELNKTLHFPIYDEDKSFVFNVSALNFPLDFQMSLYKIVYLFNSDHNSLSKNVSSAM